jgi:membrane protease YdiL (CAAX protease family)
MTFSIAILAVVLTYTWAVAPIAHGWVTPIPIALVLALAIWHSARSGDWGVRPAAFLPALWRSAVLTAAGAPVIYLAGSRLGTWHDRGNAWTSIALLIPWGFGQQFALQTVFLRDAQATVGRPIGIVLAALLFAALHLPNPFLTAMTFAGALAWCWIYDRHPNAVPLALSHALLTLAILYAFDESVTGHLRVGASYLTLLRR